MNKVIQRALEIVGSQKRLADICGVSQPAVHKWLNGGSVSPESRNGALRYQPSDRSY
ncbi:TPA: helix-turn-helix domain-containing protein [Enterobacter roggenkampii]|nr:helix-turn-helix domain-containing protein [Enterobacter roggenkampii]